MGHSSSNHKKKSIAFQRHRPIAPPRSTPTATARPPSTWRIATRSWRSSCSATWTPTDGPAARRRMPRMPRRTTTGLNGGWRKRAWGAASGMREKEDLQWFRDLIIWIYDNLIWLGICVMIVTCDDCTDWWFMADAWVLVTTSPRPHWHDGWCMGNHPRPNCSAIFLRAVNCCSLYSQTYGWCLIIFGKAWRFYGGFRQ